MKTVKVNRTELLKKVEENRSKHREVFLDAQKGFRKEAIKRLEESLERARQGKRVSLSIRLIEPMDQTREYDRTITMLKMSTETEIELTQQEFAQYVMDDWSWKNQFISSTSVYNSDQLKDPGFQDEE